MIAIPNKAINHANIEAIICRENVPTTFRTIKTKLH